MLEVDGDQVPGGGDQFQKIGQRYVGFRSLPAGGFKSFPLTSDGWADSTESPLPESVLTDNYRLELTKEGLIRQITAANGQKLLALGKYLGGEIRAIIGDQWVDNRSAACKFYDGPVCSVVQRSGTLGPRESGPSASAPASAEASFRHRRIPLRERYYFFKHHPVIKAELDFDFDDDEIGDMHIEETKLNVYYPAAGSEIYHDIPFGYLPGREQEQLFATSWCYCGGLVYVNRGTIKHWVQDRVLANTIAWGGRRFSNRIGWEWTDRRQYDLRLKGQQRIEYFLIPLGKFDGPAITRAAEDLIAPVFLTTGQGEKSLYHVDNAGLAVTALFERDGEVWARGYQTPSTPKGPFRDWEIFNAPLKSLP